MQSAGARVDAKDLDEDAGDVATKGAPSHNFGLLNRVVFPGETYTVQEACGRRQAVRVGIGMEPCKADAESEDGIHITKAGVVCADLKNRRAKGSKKIAPKMRVEHLQRRYIPRKDDRVIGTVTLKTGYYYRLEFGGPMQGVLGALEFEGATKRNRPELQVGDLVYCRVSLANRDMAPQLTCKHPHFTKSWVTKEAVFAKLQGGHCAQVSCNWADKLLRPKTPHLSFLGKLIPFECVVANNGRVWLNTAAIERTILIANAIRNGEFMSFRHFQVMVNALFNRYLGRDYQLTTADVDVDMDDSTKS